MNFSEQGYSREILVANKKNVVITAVVLFLMGISMLILGIRIGLYSYSPFTTIIPICYLVTSITGLLSSQFPKKMSILAYKLSLAFLILMNSLLAITSTVLFICLLMNPYVKPADEDSGLAGGVFLLITIIAALTILISVCVIIMLIIFYKMLIKFQSSQSQLAGMHYELRSS